MNLSDILGREENLFKEDLENYRQTLFEKVSTSKFLVIGGAGSIGQAVTKEIFKRNPLKLHVVDISENNMVELVRDIRSTLGYIEGDFKSFVIDCGSSLFERFIYAEGPYDYIFNLSALKHVRSEKDPYTLMRMIEVNILNTIKLLKFAKKLKVKKYFGVSTDKAANPVNMMGGSKRIMEMFMMLESNLLNISTARFANVAFSDGSLLNGFQKRFEKKQPITAPLDIKRYFVSSNESGELCLLSCLLGNNREIFFPKLSEKKHLICFSEIAKKFLNVRGYEVVKCNSEEECRELLPELLPHKKWPCYFFSSDTTGEKDYEEFYTDNEKINLKKFKSLGVVTNNLNFDEKKLNFFLEEIKKIQSSKYLKKKQIVELFSKILPNFSHVETGRNLDQRM